MNIFSNFSDIIIYFSNIIGIPILNKHNIIIGRVKDIFVNYEEIYPTILAIKYKKNNDEFYVQWEDIELFSYKKIIISDNAYINKNKTYPKIITESMAQNIITGEVKGETIEYPSIGNLILDRQIVDTYGKKVVRVNDIQMIRVGDNIRVTHVAVGIRSMIRRLSLEKIIDNIVKIINKKSTYLTKEKLINWKYVNTIPNPTIDSAIKLNLSNENIQGIHPADLADILEDLDSYGREIIFSNMDPKMAAEILPEVNNNVKLTLLNNVKLSDMATIIENMDSDDATDILNEVDAKQREEIIKNIQDIEIKEEISELLEYEEDTAGGLMRKEMIVIFPEYKKSNIIEIIKDQYNEFEHINYIYITDKNNKLLGVCPIHKLLIQDDNTIIGNIMDKDDLKTLNPEATWKEIASYMSKYNLINVPIIDKKQILLGIISIDDVLPWIIER